VTTWVWFQDVNINRLEWLVRSEIELDPEDRSAITCWVSFAQQEHFGKLQETIFTRLSALQQTNTTNAVDADPLQRMLDIEKGVEGIRLELPPDEISQRWPGSGCRLVFDNFSWSFDSERVFGGYNKVKSMRTRGGILLGTNVDVLIRVVLAFLKRTIPPNASDLVSLMMYTNARTRRSPLPKIQDMSSSSSRLGQQTTLIICPLNFVHTWKVGRSIVIFIK
jgi:hypothetical protein